MSVSAMKIILIDNKDSFTYNIAHIVRAHSDVNLQIIEADSLNQPDLGLFDKLIFSPGPDLPRPGNGMERLLGIYGGKKPILGICLGLQAIYIHFGGRLKRLEEPVHGRKKIIKKTGVFSKILRDLPESFEAGLYHSWIGDADYLPECLTVTALSDEERIMAISHKEYDIEAVQFHPESIMTPLGNRMIDSWLNEKSQ